MLRVAISEVQGLKVQGSEVQGSRFRGSGFKVQGSGFRVQGSGFRVQGSGFKVQGSRVQGSGFNRAVGPKSGRSNRKKRLACGNSKLNNEYRILRRIEVRYSAYYIKKIEQSESTQ